VKATGPVCTICQREKLDQEDWFLMIENERDDRLRVLQWNDALALHAGVYAACGRAHVQELAAHWIATGSLAHPFAHASQAPGKMMIARRRPAWAAEVDNSSASAIRLLGELAVHREALNRILLQNPQSLVSVLDALVCGLDNSVTVDTTGEEVESQDEGTLVCVPLSQPRPET
jgi:hypothetical protein